MKRTVTLIVMSCLGCWLVSAEPVTLKKDGQLGERHLYLSANLNNTWEIEKWLGLMEDAQDVGYTHVLLNDSKFSKLDHVGAQYFDNVTQLTDEIRRLGMTDWKI